MPENGEAELTFERAIERLGEIVETLEKGDLPLERSLALFEEGVVLSRLGADRLDRAEARVEQLLANQTTKPLSLDSTQNALSPSRPASPATSSEKEPR
jgi:exodeoxyribonuclease VII small subunit